MLSYREVMARVLERLGAPPEERDTLGQSLPVWSVFPEVPGALEQARARSWRLCILSNTDRDFLDASMAAIGVPFDRSIVASEIGSYKPAPGHWRAFEEQVGRLPEVHVAASLFHDVAPTTELGIPCIWINRLREDADGYEPAASCRPWPSWRRHWMSLPLPDGVSVRALRTEDAADVAELLAEYERSFGHEPSRRRGRSSLVGADEPRGGLVAARRGGNGRGGRLARPAGR